VVWGAGKEDGTRYEDVTVHTEKNFPFLDMELEWKDQELQFKVHLKENQQLKYLNSGSEHPQACYKAIPNGVNQRLAKLTTRTPENETITIDELYGEHAKAFEQAGYSVKFPTLGEACDDRARTLEKKKAKLEEEGTNQADNGRKRKQKKKRLGQVYCCMKFSRRWKRPVHAVLNKLKKKHGLGWLRISMSYSKHSNFRELLQADLGGKVMDGIVSGDYYSKPCNCSKPFHGLCNKEGALKGEASDCRESTVVYKATCKICDSSYIGNSSRQCKLRQQEHVASVVEYVNKDKKSTAFAEHFGEHFKELGVKDIDRDHVRAMVKYEVVWVGNRISAAKSFGKRTCRLCMKERLAILELSETNPKKMINSRNELYGACRHGSSLKVIKKTESKFHRYRRIVEPVKHSSTDEGNESQKGSGLGELDYLEPYRIGTNGIKEIPNPYENWWEGSKLNGVTICPEIGPNLAVSV
jgi:hypothetical protein